MRHIAIADIDKALWEEGPVSLLSVSHDIDLMALLDVVRSNVPEVLAADGRYAATPQRPSLWPDLIAAGLDRLATAAFRATGSPLGKRRSYTYRDGAIDLARRAGCVVPEAAAIAAIEAALLAALGGVPDLAAVLARPEFATRPALAEAVLRVALLRVRKRNALGLDPRSSPAAIELAVRKAKLIQKQWLAQIGRSTFLTIDDLLQKVPGSARLQFARLPPCNILVCGKSGAGKSTLINAVFGRDAAKTGIGRPITDRVNWYQDEHFPVRLMDTRGLEPGDYQGSRDALETAIGQAQSSGDPDWQLHLVWLCVDEGGRRIEAADVDLARMLGAHKVPAVCVLTKAWDEISMEAEARARLPDPPVASVVRVIASPKTFASGLIRQSMGLGQLVEETERLLPEAFQGAFAAAQNVLRDPKIRHARTVIAAATASAAAAAATPVPFASATLLVPIQMGMIFGISRAVGLDLKHEAIKPVVGAALGTLATTFTGRAAAAAVGEVLKAIPGVGSLVGGAVDAAVAGSLTKALGEGYLDFLTAHIHAHGQWPGTGDLVAFFRDVWLRPGKKAQVPARLRA